MESELFTSSCNRCHHQWLSDIEPMEISVFSASYFIVNHCFAADKRIVVLNCHLTCGNQKTIIFTTIVFGAASLDYRSADGRFTMSPRRLPVSNKNHLSSSPLLTRVNADIRRWELHLSESIWCKEPINGIRFTNKWRAASPLLSLGFDNVK